MAWQAWRRSSRRSPHSWTKCQLRNQHCTKGDACYYPTLAPCVWYLQVLALANVSSYTITITDPAPSTNIVPGVPSVVAIPAAASCSQLVFNVPLSQGLSSLSFAATASPPASVSMFLDDDTLSYLDPVHFADSNTAYWQSSSITSSPVTVTPADGLFSLSALSQLAGNTSGNYYATLCAPVATSVTLTVSVVSQLPSTPLPVSVNGAAVTGTVAAGGTAYTSVTVIGFLAALASSLTFSLSSPSTGLVMYVSPSFYPGPTSVVPYANFSNSAIRDVDWLLDVHRVLPRSDAAVHYGQW